GVEAAVAVDRDDLTGGGDLLGDHRTVDARGQLGGAVALEHVQGPVGTDDAQRAGGPEHLGGGGSAVGDVLGSVDGLRHVAGGGCADQLGRVAHHHRAG